MTLRRNSLLVSFSIVLALTTPMLHAQCDNTTMGRDFWLMFLQNFGGYSDMSLAAYAPDNTQIHIMCPRQSWDTTVNITTAGLVNIPLQSSVAGGQYTSTPGNHGLHVTATHPISLYASSYMYASYDIATIFPTDVLDTEYVLQVYPCFNGATAGFVAVEDSTWLTYTLPCSTSDPFYFYGTPVDSAGTVCTVMLRQGQCHHIVANRNEDLSGMRVTSNGKRFAAFQGATCANVPEGCGACDHLYEQCVPPRYWGQRFVIVPTALQIYGDRVRITSASDSNQLVLDGTTIATLMSGETFETTVASGQGHLLESSHPAYVCLYIKGHGCSGGPGDPASVTIPPVEQGVSSVSFQALTTTLTTSHFVNIVTRSTDTAGLRIDGQPPDTSLTPMACDYSYVQLPISAGPHTITNDSGTFEAFFYSLGNYESYAYLAGMAMHDMTHSLLVNGTNARYDDIYLCLGDEAELHLYGVDDSVTVSWSVDNEPAGGDSMVLYHQFNTPGIHRITAALPELCDTLRATVIVNPPSDTVTLHRSICQGDSLRFGESYYTDSGSYSLTTGTASSCDSITILELTLRFPSQTTVVDSLCPGSTYYWHGGTYTIPGNYYDTLRAANGCDSVVLLMLGARDTIPITIRYDTICFNSTLAMNGHFYDSTGIFLDTMTTSNGCDSVVELHLFVLARPVVYIDTAANCTDSSYYLSVDLSEAVWEDDVPAFTWHATPPDTLLTGHEHDTTVLVMPHSTTLYSLTFDYQCPFEESLSLEPLTFPSAEMMVTPETLTYDQPTFNVYDISSGASGRQWLLDGSELAFNGNPLCHTISAAQDSIIVGLVVWSHPSCCDTAYRSIRLLRETLWAPNVFTPDNETNRIFSIISIGITQEELDIFNRLGLLVYHSDHPAEGWDGTHDGLPCVQDTYVWRLKYRTATLPEKTQTKVGTVTLLR